MKKGFISVVLPVCVLLALTAAGCDNGIPGTHTHTYSSDWSYDSAQHWHECTDGDGAKADEANHDGVNSCSICGWVELALKLPEGQVYQNVYTQGVGNVMATPIEAVTRPVVHFAVSPVGIPLSSYFTGSAALTNGKISVDLTLNKNALPNFNAFNNFDVDICGDDVNGLMISLFGDSEMEYCPGLCKVDENKILTNLVTLIFVDRDVTFTADPPGGFQLKGVSIKKGWNYISMDWKTKNATRITDISDCIWAVQSK